MKDEGGTVVYSTHHLAEAQQVCDRIIIVHNGIIQADGTPEELLELTETSTLEEARFVDERNCSAKNGRNGKAIENFRNVEASFTPSSSLEVSQDE